MATRVGICPSLCADVAQGGERKPVLLCKIHEKILRKHEQQLIKGCYIAYHVRFAINPTKSPLRHSYQQLHYSLLTC